MNKKTKKKWVKALRSGKYEQGIHYMWCDGRFCAIGVLCDVEGLEFEEFEDFDSGEKIMTRRYDGIQLGMYRESLLGIVALMNDNGVSFDALADYIEKNL